MDPFCFNLHPSHVISCVSSYVTTCLQHAKREAALHVYRVRGSSQQQCCSTRGIVSLSVIPHAAVLASAHDFGVGRMHHRSATPRCGFGRKPGHHHVTTIEHGIVGTC